MKSTPVTCAMSNLLTEIERDPAIVADDTEMLDRKADLYSAMERFTMLLYQRYQWRDLTAPVPVDLSSVEPAEVHCLETHRMRRMMTR